jgi:hypothetical protein
VGLLATVLLAACGPASGGAKQGESSSLLEPVAGARISRVVLTAQAAALIGIKTDFVVRAGAGTAQSTSVPVAALVYEPDGTVWVYTVPANTSKTRAGTVAFVREPVTVARIEGEAAVLQSGPPVGTVVVTVGVAELLGTEYRVAGGG